MKSRFEIVYICDPRFSGGTSTALVNEIDALSREGIVPAILWVRSPILGSWRDVHPDILDRIESGKAQIVGPKDRIFGNLVIIHHPLTFKWLPAQAMRVTGDKHILVLHEPPLNGFGQPNYSLPNCIKNAEETLGAVLSVAPVGPKVREQILELDRTILPEDWLNLIDTDKWCPRPIHPMSERMIIGRHSRPQRVKWPDSADIAQLVYPDCANYEIRMLGASNDLVEDLGPIPANWKLLPFKHGAALSFLQGLDAYVYYHSAEWVEAFGLNVLEAMSVGLPVILAPDFQDLFGTGAIYAVPDQVPDLLHKLSVDPEFRISKSKEARSVAIDKFGLNKFLPRLDRLFPDWRKRIQNPETVKPSRKRVLMVTSNGVGLGHLTRLLAIAERLEPNVEVAFLTMSLGFGIAERLGYLTQYLPFHRYTGEDPEVWNQYLQSEMTDFMSFFRPDVLVFDGGVPYPGLLAACQGRPQMHRIWLRRAMWNERQKLDSSIMGFFDAIVEPDEVSTRFDIGQSVAARDQTVVVPPIIFTDADRRLPAQKARAAFGLQTDSISVGMMIGADNNFDRSELRNAILDHLTQQNNLEVIEFRSPINTGDKEETRGANHKILRTFPVFDYSKAFDFMVSGAGYNSFHEIVAGQIPTILVPNEAPEMDMQITRARHLDSIGAGKLLRTGDILNVVPVLDWMLQRDNRDLLSKRMVGLEFQNGATDAADFLRRMLDFTRCNLGG